MNYLKTIFFTAVFAFTLNAATAQTTNKKSEKTTTQQRVEQSEKLSAKEPTYKWAYSVAMVTNHGGKFDVKFMEGKSKTSQRLARQNEALNKRMESSAEELQTEGDLINFLSDMKMELISVVNEVDGKAMKYYLRTQYILAQSLTRSIG